MQNNGANRSYGRKHLRRRIPTETARVLFAAPPGALAPRINHSIEDPLEILMGSRSVAAVHARVVNATAPAGASASTEGQRQPIRRRSEECNLREYSTTAGISPEAAWRRD